MAATAPPGKINGKKCAGKHIDRFNSIAALGLPDGIALSVHQSRLLKLAREGRKMSSRDRKIHRCRDVTLRWFYNNRGQGRLTDVGGLICTSVSPVVCSAGPKRTRRPNLATSKRGKLVQSREG